MEYFESNPSSLKPSHVYISFRGDEGNRKFIHSLSTALKAEGFRIFGDDKKHEKSDSNLPPHLRQAIGESWIWIVVFSKNYASSSWCFKELARFAQFTLVKYRYVDPVIVEREQRFEAEIDQVNGRRRDLKKGFGPRNVLHRIIAVFYDVDPKSFAHHIQQACAQFEAPYLMEAIEKVVATPSAWDLRNDSGSRVIQKIVKQVKSEIDKLFYGIFRFVGIQSQVEEVEKLLDLSLDDVVGVVGICGMGGLGKFSIAMVLYLKIFHHFDAFCFLPSVSRRLKQGDITLQELLQRHLGTENSEVRDCLDKEFLACKRLRNHKFLIVLDGVELVQDLQELNLVEKSNCFGGGSRIIITTRDKQVLQNYEVDTVYRPKPLSDDEAFELFCSEAFPMEYPVSDFQEMIHKALEYAKGLPLAIKILGSTLFGKGVAEWRSVLDREEIIPPYDVIMMLRESFDELDDMSKEMFLDIACFFVGRDVNYVKEILHDCISCSVDIELLIQKSLITIVNQKIQMHGILQAMGREIVRKQCPNQPAKRRRLYLYGDIEYVMEDGIYEVIENVEAIVLDLEEPKGVALRSDALPNMINLRLLIFRNVQFYGNLDNLSSKLRYVSWDQYPFTCLPSSFQSDTLVQLIMPDSNMTQGWEGKMMLPMLRKMNLCGSKSLIKTPDFGGVPNLERLELEGCTGLLQLHPSIAELSKLKSLNLRGCTNLVSIPNSLFSLNSLQVLNLAGCSELAYCLNFSPLKSSVEVELLGIWYSPYLEKLLYFLLFVLPEPKRLSGFCLLLYYLLYACL